MLMRKKTLLAVAVLLAQAVSAQALKDGVLSNVTRLTKDAEKYENPQWSPDGTKIAFTQLGYNSLYLMNADGSSKVEISSDEGIGYDFKWSADSREILVRDTRWLKTETGEMRVHAAWSIGLDGKKIRLSEDIEYMQPANWKYSINGTKSIVSPDVAVIESPALLAMPSAITDNIKKRPDFNLGFHVDGENLYLINARGNKVLINEGASFCPRLSPDGTKVAFNQMDDVCVMNIDGSNKIVIGQGFNPSWANDSQIIYEKTTDDGHVYTSGDLYIANIDGTGIKQITSTTGRIEMQPSVSPDGTKVVFMSFTDGQLYVADLK